MSSNTPDHEFSRPADVSELFGSVDFDVKPHRSPHGRVTAVSMMKDEGPFVLEWVAHHMSIGFTDLVVYTNDCSDGTDEMLLRLEALGLVHHRRNDIPEGIRPQPSALKHAQVEPVVCNSDWVMVFDADEFLCLKQGDGTLDDMLTATKELGANGVVVTWRIFGSDGVQDWSRAPVTEQYLSAAPPMWNKGWGVKTLFKFDPEYWKLGIHRPKIKNKHLETDFPHSVQWLNGSGRPMEEYFKFRGWRSIVRTVGYDWAQLNHYAIKSMDSYAIRKFRGNVNNKKDKYNASYWSLQDRNEVHDASALAHQAGRQEILEKLLRDEVLHRLHTRAVERVEARLQEYRGTPAYGALIADLKEASKVPITQVEAKPPKARDPKKIAAQMSQIEKKVAVKAKAQQAAQTGQQLPIEANPYVSPGGDFSQSVPIKTFANHDIYLPADPRIFTGEALQAVTEGKFNRNHARRLPGMLTSADHYLEIGTGIGFLPAYLAQQVPGLTLTAQEEVQTLFSVANVVWKVNLISQTKTRKLVNTPLFHADDPRRESSGLNALLNTSQASFVYVNDPRISAEMLKNALSLRSESLPRCVVVGPRALAGVFDPKQGLRVLTALSYAEPSEQPLNASLTVTLNPTR